MRRIISVALLALGGTFAMSGVASADIEDIRNLSIDEDMFGDASSVEVTGQIRCAATIEYGVWVGVAQDPADPDVFEFGAFDGDPEEGPADVEGVGAYGPSFDPPVGTSDDSPCSQSLQSFDVLVQQNRDSGDFEDGDLAVELGAGTSAENGGRGPGPMIADMGRLDTSDVNFERTR